MPTIIFLMIIMSFVAYAALLQANNGLNISYKQAYLQMARVAAKASIDYAQEQFDKSLCGAYTGTAEQDLVANDQYRTTFKVEVLGTSTDGYEKTIKGTGSIYLPKSSSTAKYVFDVRSEIVRTYALCKTPPDFAPLLWLDASDQDTLKKANVTLNTLTDLTTFGDSSASVRDTIEERYDNGTQTTNSWQSNDLEMHTCDSAEFSSSICTNNSQKYTYSGIAFENMNIPKDAYITSALMEISGGTPAGTQGTTTHRIRGIYKDSTNPHIDLFTSGGSNQVRAKMTTSGLYTSEFEDVSTNNFPPGNTRTFDVREIVQEMVGNTNWNPSANGGRLGFGIYRLSGPGSRRAKKDGMRLTVTYSTTAVSPSTNGDEIGQWDDKSANQYHAKHTHGNPPKRFDNQINGKTVVRFENGDMLSTLTTALSGKREMTVLGVLKPDFNSSNSDGRFVSGMTSAATNDTGGTNSIIPLLRNANGNGFSSIYASTSTSNRTDYTCGSTCANTPFLVSSNFTIADNDSITATLKGNGVIGASKTDISPSASPSPYVYGINQLYFGGSRSGAMPGGGTNYLNGDFAEIIVYDKALSCRDIESLEEYLRSKWNTSANAATSTCPDTTIPTL